VEESNLRPKPIVFPPIDHLAAAVPPPFDPEKSEEEFNPYQSVGLESHYYPGVGRLGFFLMGWLAPVIVWVILVSVGAIKLAKVLDPATSEVSVEMVRGMPFQILIGIWVAVFWVQRFRNLGANPWLWTALTFVPIFNIYCMVMLFCAPPGNWHGRQFDFAGKVSLAFLCASPVLLVVIALTLGFLREPRWTNSPEPEPPALENRTSLRESGVMPALPDTPTASTATPSPSPSPTPTPQESLEDVQSVLAVPGFMDRKYEFTSPSPVKIKR
jgi:hypothetical protein